MNKLKFLCAGLIVFLGAGSLCGATDDTIYRITVEGPDTQINGLGEVAFKPRGSAARSGAIGYDEPLDFTTLHVEKDEYNATGVDLGRFKAANADESKDISLDLNKIYQAMRSKSQQGLTPNEEKALYALLRAPLGVEQGDDGLIKKRLAGLIAAHNVYQNRLRAARLTYGMEPRAALQKLNNDFPEDRKAQLEVEAQKVALLNDIDPSVKNKVFAATYRRGINPLMRFYNNNEEVFNAFAKISLILSAAAYVFNKFGGTEYVRKRIDEAFRQPEIFHFRQGRKNRWFGNKSDELMNGNDLVLAPETRKQVNELIFLINRRAEMAKTTKKKYTLPRVLLWGPPGTAKTSIAQLIADQTIGDDGKPMNFIKIMASEFMQVINEGDRIVVLKKMFDKARREGNTIIFLDEIDGMTNQRGKDSKTPNRAFLDHLLDELANPSTRYMVIAATNHIGNVDNALLSRFTRQISIGLPPPRQRKMILDLYVDRLLKAKGYEMQVSTATIANIMKGSPGRELEAFVERLGERLEFDHTAMATQTTVDDILRDMGKLPPLPADNTIGDLEDELLNASE
ncbi:MAG: hypothetical protein QG604_65 [Candidatus Dependentiae bacterium]|nr:hypothetical protein [Candidatus Dependentiae bacterium]